MSTLERSDINTSPPIEPGQRLDPRTFHERYEAMPPGTWAELIGGEVVMPSPWFDDHGGTGDVTSYWLGHYRRFTPGLRSSANATTILGPGCEVQPDHQLRLLPESGGAARVVGGYVQGPPELIVEVSRSSRRLDLGQKKSDYERAGVREYAVVEQQPDSVHWFVLQGDHYQPLPADPDGIHRSVVFPGLWLDPRPLYANDLDGMVAVLERGLATPEHAEFVARLTGREP